MKSKIIKVVIACIVVVGVGVAGYIVYAKNTSKHMSFAATRYVTAAVSKQSISTTIQGTGTAYAATTEAITANNSGTISSLSVKVGDSVTAGQTLFVSSSDDVTKSVTTANNNLSKQKLTLSSDETALANAESKVTADNTAIAEAVTALSTAKANSSLASTSTSTSTSTSASSSSAQGSAQQGNSGIPQGNSGNQQSSSNSQSGSTVDSVTTAQNKLTQLQSALKNDENSVKNYTSSIVTDKIAVSEAEADLTTAKSNLSKMTVTSPIAGLVTAVNYSNGDSVQGTSSSSGSGTSSSSSSGTNAGTSSSSGSSSGSGSSVNSNSNSSAGTSSSSGSSSSVLTVVDMNSIKIKVSVDELDVSKIKVGQSATIKFDALSDKSFTGTVEEVPQTGTTSNNVTTYDIVVKVNNPSGIKLGMSANVAITIESKDNALVIPADALVEKNNKKYVKVQNTTSSNSTDLENSGNLVEIKTGIENLNYIEVTSGISQGQQVIYKSTSSGMPGNMGNIGKINNSSNSKAASSGNNSSSKSSQ